jgi:hypothetical protein
MTNPLNLSEQQLNIFKEIIVNDLKEYAKLLSERHSLNYDEIVSLIPEVLDKPVYTKISSSFHDISNIKYKKDLDKYTLSDLREISKKHCLKTTGKKTDLIDRISTLLNLKEFSNEEILSNKSFISKPFKNRIKTSAKKNISNITYDSD